MSDNQCIEYRFTEAANRSNMDQYSKTLRIKCPMIMNPKAVIFFVVFFNKFVIRSNIFFFLRRSL